MNEQEKKNYQKAQKKVEELKGFYIHLTVYLIVNMFIFIQNVITLSVENYWFYWPLLGWGIGLLSHWISIFGLGRFLGEDWEKKKIEQYMEKIEKTETEKSTDSI